MTTQTAPRPFRSAFLSMTIMLALASGSAFAQAPSSPQIPDDQPALQPASQQPDQPTQQPPKKTMTFGEVYQSVNQADPTRRAGLRSSLIAQSMQVVPIVLIVDNPSAYLDAIASWEGPVKFPVLYDDSTDLAREHIARFVRDFNPDEVVRITNKGQAQWGSSTADRQASIDTALAASFQQSQPNWRATLKALKATGVVSPGVVVIDPMDRHWAGGLALAAGRLQPVIYIGAPDNATKELEPHQAQAYNQSIEQGLRKLDLSFDQIGDEIDTITLAFRLGVKIKTGPNARDRLATTDQIGRQTADLGGMRWAWSGQLFGTTTSSVYQAMCSLFLPMDSAFVWDGYSKTGSWDKYDGTEAAQILEDAGMEVELFDKPRNTLASFKGRASSRPVDASLIFMNSKGAQSYFDLADAPDGQGRPGDLPMLQVPSVLHMVHSFSLATPRSSLTVGGRWLDRGVYLYAGSVDEPFLSGFVQTPIVAKRILGQLPFAAAIHYDDGQAWKITVLGDPLKTISPCGNRFPSIPEPLTKQLLGQGAQFLEQHAKDMLKAGNYTSALESFVLNNQDDSAVRVAKALFRDKPAAVDDTAATVIIHAAFRQGEYELVLDAFERLSNDERTELQIQDTLWMAARYRANRFQDSRAIALMRANLRKHQELQDAEDIAMAIRRDSIDNAVAYLQSLRATYNSSGDSSTLDKAISRIRR